MSGSAAHDVREVEVDWLLKLGEPAGRRITVGAPADELGGVTEHSPRRPVGFPAFRPASVTLALTNQPGDGSSSGDRGAA